MAQPGQHIYSITAYNDKGAGAASEHTATIGAKVEAATAHYYARYNDATGKMTIEWPAKADVTTYQVATVDGRILDGTLVLNEETASTRSRMPHLSTSSSLSVGSIRSPRSMMTSR